MKELQVQCNSNCLLLLRNCAEHDIPITNTDSRLPNRTKTSWLHPRSKIFQTLASHRLCHSADNRQAECQSNKYYVVSKLNLRTSRQEISKRTGCLKAEAKQHETNFLNGHLQPTGCNQSQFSEPRKNWTVFHNTVYSSAATTLRQPSCKHQDLFDDDGIQRLLEEKHELHNAQLDDSSSVSTKSAYIYICKTVQTKLRNMQDSWLRKKSENNQSFADRKDIS